MGCRAILEIQRMVVANFVLIKLFDRRLCTLNFFWDIRDWLFWSWLSPELDHLSVFKPYQKLVRRVYSMDGVVWYSVLPLSISGGCNRSPGRAAPYNTITNQFCLTAFKTNCPSPRPALSRSSHS